MRHLLHIAGRRLAMLLVAVMLFVPVVDAFACAAEPVSAHAALDGDTAQDNTGDGHADGLCGHNHCHHNTSGVIAEMALGAPLVRGASLWASYDDLHLFGGTDGLLRPPRS